MKFPEKTAQNRIPGDIGITTMHSTFGVKYRPTYLIISAFFRDLHS